MLFFLLFFYTTQKHLTQNNVNLKEIFMTKTRAATGKKSLVIMIECVPIKISLAENQKGVNAVQRCSVENQKGAIAIYFVQRWRPSGSQPQIYYNNTRLQCARSACALGTGLTRPFHDDKGRQSVVIYARSIYTSFIIRG